MVIYLITSLIHYYFILSNSLLIILPISGCIIDILHSKEVYIAKGFLIKQLRDLQPHFNNTILLTVQKLFRNQ